MYENIKVSNTLPCEKGEKLNKKFETKTMNILVSNCNGLKSKFQSVSNICKENDIRMMILTETHEAGGVAPFVDRAYKSFFLNRNEQKYQRCKGGVAILVERQMAQHCVITDKLKNVNEVLIVRNNAFRPALITVGIYGGQPSQYSTEEIRNAWAELLIKINEYHNKGHTVIWGGDCNAWIGNQIGLEKNDPSTNVSGKIIIDFIKANPHWTLLNRFDENCQTTHTTYRKADKSRCLDLIFTNAPDMCNTFKNDDKKIITPYRVIKDVKYKTGGKLCTADNDIVLPGGNVNLDLVEFGEEQRKYSDHNSLFVSMKLDRNNEAKIEKPVPIVIRNEESNLRYAFKTDEIADDILEMIEKKASMNDIYKLVVRSLEKADRFAFQRIKTTRIKIQAYKDNQMIGSLQKKIDDEMDKIKGMRIERQVWKVSKARESENRNEEFTSMINKDGRLVETKAEIDKVLADYNEKLLSRNRHPERFRKLHELKKSLVKNYINQNDDNGDTLTEKEYLRALRKIYTKGKSLFKPFINTSSKFKAAFFYVMKLMYDSEEVPEELLVTTLKPLYKKGDKRRPENYRYLHLRNWMSRLYELIIYFKLEDCYERITGEAQHGGKKMHDCVEQLSVILHLCQKKEKEGEGLVMTLCDIVKCFDNVFLDDAMVPLVKGNANIKAARQLYNSKKENTIVFENSEATFKQNLGIGQGGHNDPRNASSVITDVCENNFEHHKDPTKFYNTKCEMSQFVDDTSCGSSNNKRSAAENARESGMLISDSLDEISLKAHGEKTVQVLIGSKDFIEKTKIDLQKLPTIIQDFEVRLAENDKLLGVTLCEGTVKEILTRNLSEKHKKIEKTAYEIKAKSNDPRAKAVGRLKFICMEVQAKIVPQALYGLEAFPNLDVSQYKMLKEMFRNAMAIALGIPKLVCYEALLSEMQQYPLEVWADIQKIKYYNKKFNIKKKGRLYRIIRHEFTREIEGGYIEDLEVLCRKYRIRSIFDNDVSEEEITKAGKAAARRQIWGKLLECKTIPLREAKYEKLPEHYLFTDFQSRLVSQMRMGVLMFRNKYSHYMRKRHQNDNSCLWGPCGEVDSLAHCLQCEFYPVRFKKTEKGEARDWAEYLTQLSNCRARNFGESLEFLAYENKTSTCDEREYEKSLKSAYEIETGDIKEVKSKLKAYRQKSKRKRENEKAANSVTNCDKTSNSDMKLNNHVTVNDTPHTNDKLIFQINEKSTKSDNVHISKKHGENHKEKQKCNIPLSLCPHLEHVSCTSDKENSCEDSFKRFKGKTAVRMCSNGGYAQRSTVSTTTATGESHRAGCIAPALSLHHNHCTQNSLVMSEDDKKKIEEIKKRCEEREKNKDVREEFEWCEGIIYGNKKIKEQTISLDDPRHSQFRDPFYRYEDKNKKKIDDAWALHFAPKKMGEARYHINFAQNCPKSLELQDDDRDNSKVLSPQETLRIQKIARGEFWHENGAEQMGLSGNNPDEKDEDNNYDPARPGNPLTAAEKLLQNIVVYGGEFNCHSGEQDEENANENADFDANFEADHG